MLTNTNTREAGLGIDRFVLLDMYIGQSLRRCFRLGIIFSLMCWCSFDRWRFFKTTCLSVFLFIYACYPLYPPVCLSAYLSLSLSVRSSIYPAIRAPFGISVHVSVCLSVCFFVFSNTIFFSVQTIHSKPECGAGVLYLQSSSGILLYLDHARYESDINLFWAYLYTNRLLMH